MSHQQAQPWWWADPEDECELDPDPEADYESEQRLTDLRLDSLL